MARRDIARRIESMEAERHDCKPQCETWVDGGDGLLRTRSGKVMTREAFDATFPNARKIKLNIFDRELGRSLRKSDT
jgi:hypothetical protein